MKYLIFAYDQYYPSGAFYEYKGFSDTLDGAKEIAGDRLGEYRFVDIVCLDEKEILHLDRGRRQTEPVVFRMEETGAFKK